MMMGRRTLIRILIRHLPAEYDGAVKAVKDLARLRKYSEGGMLEAITNCEDNTRANYAIDYLPDYAELRFELIRTYQLAERRRSEMNKTGGKKGHPSFPIMDGHTQPGPGMQSCYRCGVKGHRAGDPACKGKEGEVHKDAPDWFRKHMGHEPKGAKVEAKAKAVGKERKAGWATGTPNPFATIGARGMGTAATPRLATYPTTVPKEARKEKGKKGQRHYRPRP